MQTAQPIKEIETLSKLLLVGLDVNIWSGRKKLRIEDLGPGVDLPPAELASLGSKRIMDPEQIKLHQQYSIAEAAHWQRGLQSYQKLLRNGASRVDEDAMSLSRECSPATSESSSSSDSEGMEVFISLLSTMAQENASQIPRPIIRRIQINRDREAGHDLLMRHCFGSEQLYNEKAFKRRFRMQRPLSERIINDLEAADTYFQLRWDARGKRGFTPLQKCTSTIQQLAYGSTADIMDDYLHISDSTSR